MPSATVSAIFQDVSSELNDQFGETVSYAPADGSAISSFDMRLSRKANLDIDQAGGAISYQALGFIPIAEIAKPAYGDQITATGPDGNAETWTVLRILQTGVAEHKVALRDDMRPF